MRSMPRRTGSLLVVLALVLSEVALADEDWFGIDASVWMFNRINVKSHFLNLDGAMSWSTPGNAFAPGRQSQGQVVVDYDDPLSLRFDKGELGYSVLLGVSTRLRFGEAVAVKIGFDSGELKLPWLIRYNPDPECRKSSDDPRCEVTSNGRPVADEARESFFLRQVFLDIGLGRDDWFSARAGKLLLSTGNGFIMDNYALGMALVFDLDLGFDTPIKLNADLVFPDGRFTTDGKRSPLVYLDAAYLMSFFEEVGLFFAWYHDGDDSLASVFSSVVREGLYAGGQRDLYARLTFGDSQGNPIPISTQGNLFWVGLRANRLFTRASLSGTAILEFGWFDVEIGDPTTPRQVRASSLAGMVDVRFHYDVTDWLTLGSFFLFLSGETFSAADAQAGLVSKYNSFIAVYPYITHTNIFFSGGMNQNFSARAFSTSGVNGRGVLAPGLTAGFDVTDDVTVRLVTAALFSEGAQLLSGQRFYGWESDLNFTWTVNDHLRLLFEADYLLTGGFFDFRKPVCEPYEYTAAGRTVLEFTCASETLVSEPSAWKIMAGLDVSF